MMAIIIVAMILVFVAFGSLVIHEFALLQKSERDFYDMFALMHFFRFICENQQWEEFLNQTEKITVIRRSVTEQDEIKKQTISVNNHVCYDFCLEDKTNSIYLEVEKVHQKKMKKLFKGSFKCDIDSQKVKMFLSGSFEQKIFIPTFEATIQSLDFVFSCLERDFKENFATYEEWSKEVKNTLIWIEKNKFHTY